MLREKARSTSKDLCTLEHCAYLAYTVSLFESAACFTKTISSALVSVEKLDSVEDALLRYASVYYRGQDEHPHILLVSGVIEPSLISTYLQYMYFNKPLRLCEVTYGRPPRT